MYESGLVSMAHGLSAEGARAERHTQPPLRDCVHRVVCEGEAWAGEEISIEAMHS